jgi:flagellar basal body P-ring formation protein FlgA
MINVRFALLLLSLFLIAPSYAEEKFQSLDSIYEFVKETVAQNIKTSADYEITVLPLDDQLKLPFCTKPLETFRATDLIKAGRASIGVRCNSEKKWSIFASAVIRAYEHVIVLTQAVQRGDIITAQHLAVEKRDVSKCRGDFVTQVEQIENKQAARNLPAGSILGLRNVIEPPMVKRKDKITISNAQPGFAIQMSGIAMMDGVKGQLIRVKNENSGRIIGATVIDSGLVLVR